MTTQTVRLGLRPEHLTEIRLAGIAGLFDRVCGTNHLTRRPNPDYRPDQILSFIDRFGAFRTSFGDPGRFHAGLVIEYDWQCNLVVRLDTFNRLPHESYPEASLAKINEFAAAITDFLHEQGVGVPLTD